MRPSLGEGKHYCSTITPEDHRAFREGGRHGDAGDVRLNDAV